MNANTISLAAGKDASNLQTLFAKMKNVYYNAGQITANMLSSAGVECELEFPVISDGVSFNTGEADVTETKLTTGATWTSRADKGDSDISFQVASIAGELDDLFLTKRTSASVTGIKVQGLEGTFGGDSYSLDVNKVTGSLVMTDDNRQTVLILTNVEMYGSLVVADGDNPAYFNVKVTPKANTDGAALLILRKEA